MLHGQCLWVVRVLNAIWYGNRHRNHAIFLSPMFGHVCCIWRGLRHIIAIALHEFLHLFLQAHEVALAVCLVSVVVGGETLRDRFVLHAHAHIGDIVRPIHHRCTRSRKSRLWVGVRLGLCGRLQTAWLYVVLDNSRRRW